MTGCASGCGKLGMMGELIIGKIEGGKKQQRKEYCENRLNSKPYKQMDKQTDWQDSF